MLDSFLHYPFLQYALAAGLLASIGCGVVGAWVVVKRIGFMAGGIAHAALGGMGVAQYYGVSPLLGATVAALLSALLIGWIRLRYRQNEDTLIATVWAAGMAIGILFISQTPGYNVSLTSFLFGNILMATPTELALMVVVNLLIIGVVTIFYRPLLTVAFDEEFARVRGLNVEFYYLLLLCIVALTVVLLIQVVGLILVLALLTLPAAIALRFSTSLSATMLLSIALGAIFVTSGLGLAFQADLPAGPVIILVAVAAYLFMLLFKKGRRAA